MPQIKLILEYDLGDDWPNDQSFSADPEDWKEYFEQMSIMSWDMKLVGIKIEED